MANFFSKTAKLWLAIACFALAAGFFFLLNWFFSSGGGVIKIKAIILPFIFVVIGVVQLGKFIISSFKKGNRLAGLLSIAFVLAVGGVIAYLMSDHVRYDRFYDNVTDNSIPEDEALITIRNLLLEDDPEAKDIAVKCLEHLASNGSASACEELGEMYFLGNRHLQKDYSKAKTYFDEAYKLSRKDPQDSFLTTDTYEHLGDIYSQGLCGEVDNEKALKYYNLALSNTILSIGTDAIKAKIEKITENDSI